MKKGERQEIYIAVEQLLKFGKILHSYGSLIDRKSKNNFYSQMFEVLDATNKFMCEGGISPDGKDEKLSHRIYDVFRNKELYNFWKEKFSTMKLDIESLNIKEVISKPRKKYIKKTKSKKGKKTKNIKSQTKKASKKASKSSTRNITRRVTRLRSAKSISKYTEKSKEKTKKRCNGNFCSRVMSVFGRGKTKKKSKNRKKNKKNKIKTKKKILS